MVKTYVKKEGNVVTVSEYITNVEEVDLDILDVTIAEMEDRLAHLKVERVKVADALK